MSLHCLGYKDVVVQEALAKVAHDGILSDLRQQHHVVHTTLLHVVTLPVKALLAALEMRDGGMAVSESWRESMLGASSLPSPPSFELPFLRYLSNG